MSCSKPYVFVIRETCLIYGRWSHFGRAKPTPYNQCPYQVSTFYTLQNPRNSVDKILNSWSLWQGQRSNQGHTVMLHNYKPNQYPYQVSTSYTLQFPRYSPDKIYRSRWLPQGQMLNQGHTMTLHTYNPQSMSLPSINFLHLMVSEI